MTLNRKVPKQIWIVKFSSKFCMFKRNFIYFITDNFDEIEMENSVFTSKHKHEDFGNIRTWLKIQMLFESHDHWKFAWLHNRDKNGHYSISGFWNNYFQVQKFSYIQNIHSIINIKIHYFIIHNHHIELRANFLLASNFHDLQKNF